MRVDRAHRRLDARVVRPRADDDADLPHAEQVLGDDRVGRDVDAAPCGRSTSGKHARRDPGARLLGREHLARDLGAGRNLPRRDDGLLEDALHLAQLADVVLVDRVREHRLDRADPLDEVLELVGLERERGVGPVELAREREVLLDHDRPERDRRERGVVAERVVGEADRPAVALAQLGEHVQADVLGRRRVLGRALEHRRRRRRPPRRRRRARPRSTSPTSAAPASRSPRRARTSSRFVTSPEPTL